MISKNRALVLSNKRFGTLESGYSYKVDVALSHRPLPEPGQFMMLGKNAFIPDLSHYEQHIKPFFDRPFGFMEIYSPEDHCDFTRKIFDYSDLGYGASFLVKPKPEGKATPWIRNLKNGSYVDIKLPLGKRFDGGVLKSLGCRHVHIIGGGVGTAPLVFLAKALIQQGYRVSFFTGLTRLDEIYNNDGSGSFLYVDEMIRAGIDAESIYVSAAVLPEPDLIDIYKKKYPHAPPVYNGFVTDCYKKNLKNFSAGELLNTVAFTCGPNPMMKVLNDMCLRNQVKLYAYLEEKMGCGVGVCFSCVCKVKKTGENRSGYEYKRICKDGPVFDAGDIVWS